MATSILNNNDYVLLKKLEKAERIYQTASDMCQEGGVIYDADSILQDYLMDVEPGMFEDIGDLYRDSKDKYSFCRLFLELTGATFEEYLDRCIKETCIQIADIQKATVTDDEDAEIKVPFLPGDICYVIEYERKLNKRDQVITTNKTVVYPARVVDVVFTTDDNYEFVCQCNLVLETDIRTKGTPPFDIVYVPVSNVSVASCFKTEDEARKALAELEGDERDG